MPRRGSARNVQDPAATADLHHMSPSGSAHRSALRVASVAIAALLATGACGRTAPPDGEEVGSVPGQVGGSEDCVVVVFEGAADLGAASREPDWRRRGRMVVDELRAASDRAQARARSVLDGADIPYRPLWVANAISLAGTSRLPDQLRGLPGVREVLSGEEATLAELIPSSAFTAVTPPPQDLWFRDALGLDALAASGATGAGTTLGIIDTGVDASHPALAPSYLGAAGGPGPARSWFDPTGVCTDRPCDPIGHGTHVAGLAAGRGIGVAPDTRWSAARGCATNACHLDDVLAAMQFMLAPTDTAGRSPDPSLRPQVVLSSWSLPEPLEALDRATAALGAAGILQIYAAGDGGPTCGSIAAPAANRGVVSVGATDRAGTIDTVSARGPADRGSGEDVEPHLVAPGRDMLSTAPGGGYARASGTSMSAPLVAGTALAVLGRAPALTGDPAAVRAVLEGSARPRPDTTCGPAAADGANDVYGHGALDPGAAVTLAAATPPATGSPGSAP